MSAQGVQKAAQLLGILNTLLPVFAEADAEGLDVGRFIANTLRRSGVPIDTWPSAMTIVSELSFIVTDQPKIVGAELPTMDAST